jgi:hypothetical protein
MEERSNGKGKLAKASEEGQGPRRAVEPMTMTTKLSELIKRYGLASKLSK